MRNNKQRKILIILMLAIFVMASVNFVPNDIYAASKVNKAKAGATYKLRQSKYIYRNHSTKSGIKYKKELSVASRKLLVKGIKRAKLRRYTKVTCLRVYGGWIKIPSGWLKYNKKDFKRLK